MSKATSVLPVDGLWKKFRTCENRGRVAVCSRSVLLCAISQGTFESTLNPISGDCGQMADNDNRKPAEREDAWEILGDVIARILRDAAQKKGAA